MTDAEPVVKRKRVAATHATASSSSTARLFAPFRALGFISDHVPFAMQVRSAPGALNGPSVQIVSCLGRSWAMWEAGKMNLLFVGPDAGAQISSLATSGNHVFAAAGSKVRRYLRGKEAAAYESTDHAQLGQILIFGGQLVALKEDGTGMYIWDLETLELLNEVEFAANFTATTILHPATYLNKVLVGSQQGGIQLWNIRTASLIHAFAPVSSASSITVLVQSPAVDVVGIGYVDGSVRVFDVRQGEELIKVKMEIGSITGVAFRMDGPPILATSSSTGTLAMWDLNQGGKILHTTRGAHEAGITGLQWVTGQPLLVTSSADNSVKQWLFDSPDAAPRLLKFRTGHHAPPSCIRYYGEDGKQILTAGRDRALRYTSVVRDSRSHELSQGHVAKKAVDLAVSVSSLKFPPITAIASSSTRSKDWEDVVTAHADNAFARTWRVQDKKLGQWAYTMDEGYVQSVCVTACGNFGIVGSSTGEIKMWNMQSGRERKSFNLTGSIAGGDTHAKIINKTKPSTKAKAPKRLSHAVTGLATDALNTLMIASTLEGSLYFFDFHTTQLLHIAPLETAITSMFLNRDSGLLGVVCDDLVVRLVDIETRRTVREMKGFKGRIMDACFSPDSRWLIASSMDSVIRTYDVPTGRLVDAFKTPSIATSLTFSPTGDFLATAHVDSVGIYLWANRAQFTDVALRHIAETDEVSDVSLPSVQGVEEDAALAGITPVGAPEYTDIYTTPDQLTEGLLTLSLMPRSRWQTLLNLETIKQRNKPKEPPKAPEQAPFFLPTVAGLETRFDLSAAPPPQSDEPNSRRLDFSAGFIESDFTRRMAREDPEGDFNSFFEYLKALSPPACDLEIRSLVSLDHLELFLTALTGRLRSHRDFEAVQAFLSVFLTVHGDVLIANDELRAGLEALQVEQRKESGRLMELISYSLGTLGFLKSS